MRGKIVRHIRNKNFAFIACEDQLERFFHAGMVNEQSTPFHDLEVGDTVDFEPIIVQVKGEPKERAADVRLFSKHGDLERAPVEATDTNQ